VEQKYYISITDFARSKNTSRQTIYNNLDYLTVEDISGRQVIILDEKAKSWNPKEHYKPKKHIKNQHRS
jgi:hypothetical protein